jgi:phospholipase D1/2
MLSSILGEERKPIRVDAQCVRSVSFWSCGTRTIEHSIQDAYIHMIESAQHFIYIEVRFYYFIFSKKKREILESIFCFNCSRSNY